MSNWTTTDPGAGDTEVIRARMSKLSSQLEHAAEMMGTVRQQRGQMDAFWSGAGHRAWMSTAEDAVTTWTTLHTWVENEYLALSRYASMVESIKARADRQKALLGNAQTQLSLLQSQGGPPSLPGLTSGPSAASLDQVAAATHASAALAALAVERQGADDDLASAIRDARQSTRAAAHSALPTAAELRAMSPVGLLSELSTLSAKQLSRLLDQDPGLASRLAATDPEIAAAWWSSLDGPAPASGDLREPSAAQKALIHGLPTVIGNLEGVAYWGRDRANHVTLAAEIARLEKHPEGDGSTLAALKSVRGALGKGMSSASPRELVSLSLDGKPKAAISVGNLDTAASVSYIVPGMGTQVNGDIGRYATAAFDMRSTQAAVAHAPLESLAVVAWLDYDPPGPSDVLGVKYDYLAQTGGKRLASSLSGFHAARHVTDAASDLSVIGHSYGTDVATIALTEVSADHVVLLGSAGIADQVPSARSLHVPTDQVFASQGHHDGWANIGQAISGRQDPTAESFGAHDINSEADKDALGNPLKAVGQHGPLVNKGTNNKFSYLDANTSAQYNTAKATMGQGAGLPVADTPLDRLKLQGQDRAGDLGWPIRALGEPRP